ncbi:cell wall-binding repeat-containing protein, partial [bacterium]|nr:cell wall-binding repeat-containing protein [bacterium]
TGQYAHQFVRFRGHLLLTASGGKIKLVNRLKTPEYLYGVVPRESPASWPLEALKAQAVAARGYALTSTRTELYTTTSDQVYGGHSQGEDRANAELLEHARTNEAVDATLGRVVTFEGTAVRTYFMSTSGGHTENNENVWAGSPLAHLRGVPDPYEVYAGASRHGWKYDTLTAAQVRTKLLAAGATPALVPDPIAGIRVVSRGVSGRPTKVEFTSATGAKTYFDTYGELLWFRNGLAWGDHWFYVDYKTTRIAGDTRYATSLVASKRVFTTAPAVIIANGDAPADALTASSLAGVVGAPILLTGASALDPGVADEIARLGATKAYVIGGTAVMPAALEQQVRAAGSISTVARLSGPDRYGT